MEQIDPKSFKSLSNHIDSKMKSNLKQSKDSDFWFDDNYYNKFVASSIEQSLSSFKGRSLIKEKGNREKFRRRAAL